MDSPVMVASSSAPSPSRITPSTGTRAPGRSTTTSPGIRSATGTSLTLPSGACRRAVSGRSAINASTARRARPMARCSSVVEMLNSVSSTAPSSGAPTPAAARAATTISRSMSSTRSRHSTDSARSPVGTPPAR
jgi:hypothetical protein